MENSLSSLKLILLLVDAGLVVLIWMVQLIVYPSFLFYQKEDLVRWHKLYTNRIAIIVIPLMLVQLVLSGVYVFDGINLKSITSLVIVLFLWIFTFTSFAPLHFKISETKADRNMLLLLVKRNWIRTIFWTALFLFHYFFQ
jgi:hypothetical protein